MISSTHDGIDFSLLETLEKEKYPIQQLVSHKNGVNEINKQRVESFVEQITLLRRKDFETFGGCTTSTINNHLLQVAMGSAIDDLNKLSRQKNTELYAIRESIKEIQKKQSHFYNILEPAQSDLDQKVEEKILNIEKQQKEYILSSVIDKTEIHNKINSIEEKQEEYVLSNVIDKTEIENRINCIEEQQKGFIRTIYTLKLIVFGLIFIMIAVLLYNSEVYWTQDSTQNCKYLLE